MDVHTHTHTQTHAHRSFQSSSQQSLDSSDSSNQERPSPDLRTTRQKTPDASPSPLAMHRTVAGAKPFGTSLSTRSDGSSNSLPQLYPSGQSPSPVISRRQEGHEAAGLASQASHVTRELRSHDHHKTDGEIRLPTSPAPPPYMSPSPDSEQARLLEHLGRGKQSKPPKVAPKPVSANLSGRMDSLDAPDLTSVDNIIMPQVQNPKQVMPDGNHVLASVTSTSTSVSPHSPKKNQKIHNIPFRTRTPDLIREIEEVMGNQQDPASAGGSMGSLGSLNRQSGSQSPKKPSPENARRPVTDSVNTGGVKPSMEARHQRRGMERQLRKSQKRFIQLMKNKEGSPGDSDQGESGHSGTGSTVSGSGYGDLHGSSELLESGNFSPSDLAKDPFEIDPRNYLSAPSPVYDKLDDVEMPGDSKYPVSSGVHQLEQPFVPPAPHITVGGFEVEEDDQQTGDGLRNILQEVMSSDNLPPPPPHLMALSQELQERESQRPGYYTDPLAMPPREPELQPHQQQPPIATTSGRSDSFNPNDLGRGRSHTTAGTYDPSHLPPEIASFMSRVRSVSTGDDFQDAPKPAASPTKFDSPRKGRRGSTDSTPQASPQVRSISRGTAEVERSQSMSTYDSPKSIRSRQGNRGSPTKRYHDPGQGLDSSRLQRHQYQRREEYSPAQSYSLPRGQKAAESSHFRHESSQEPFPSTHGAQPHGGHRTGSVEAANVHTRTGSVPITWEYAQQDVRRAQSFNTARQVPLHPRPPAGYFEEESIPNSPTYFAQNPPLDRDEVNPSPHTQAVNRSFQDHLNSLNSGRRGRKTRVLDWMQRTSGAWGHDSRYPMMQDPATNQPAAPYLRPSHVYEEPDAALRRKQEEWQQHQQQQHRQQHQQRRHGHHGRPRGSSNKATAYASHTYAGHEQRQGYPAAKVGKDYYVIDV